MNKILMIICASLMVTGCGEMDRYESSSNGNITKARSGEFMVVYFGGNNKETAEWLKSQDDHGWDFVSEDRNTFIFKSKDK